MSIGRTLQANLIAGVLVLTPAVVSIYVFVQLFLLLDRPLGRALEVASGLRIPGVGFAALTALVLLVGVLTRNLVGIQLVRLAQRVITSVPLLGKLYGVLEQTLATVLSGRGRSFRRVVLVEYPVPGVWSLAFLAGERGVELAAGVEPLVRVFLPTAPNPTTGFVLLVPPVRLRESSLTVEEALKMLVSGGLVGPRADQESDAGVDASVASSPAVESRRDPIHVAPDQRDPAVP